MLKKVTDLKQDVNEDRTYTLECGHVGKINFEQLRGNAARRMPKTGQMYDCALCVEPIPDTIYNPGGDMNGAPIPKKGAAPKPEKDLTMPDARPLDVKLKELLGVTKLESKLNRIKAILEEN